MKLRRPAGVLAVLGAHELGDRHRQNARPALVEADTTAEGGERVGRRARQVVPALDR